MKVKDIQTIAPFTIYAQVDIRNILYRLPPDSEVISITTKQSSLNSEGEIFVHSYDVWVAIKKNKDKEYEPKISES